MAFELRSTAEYYGELIDCRALTFSFEFYQFTEKMAIDLSTELVLWVEEWVKEGFITKRFSRENKNTTMEKALIELKGRIQSQRGGSYGLEAYVVNSIVYNKKTMTGFERKKHLELPTVSGINLGVSPGYPQYWKELFPNGREDNELIRQKIIRLFREEGRIYKNEYCSCDVEAYLCVGTYCNNKKSFYGSFEIDFSAFCLKKQLSETSREFLRFAKQLGEKYVNLNARVRLQPAGETYGHYFRGYDMLDKSHLEADCGISEWYPTYYLKEVEWMNIVSPLAEAHLENHIGNIKVPDSVLLERLQGGGLLVGSRKDIDEYDISDALELKRLLYPALYPGLSSYTLRDLFRERDRYKGCKENWGLGKYPRSDWAIVPVFEEEIKIVATYLVITTIQKKEEEKPGI